MYTKLFNLINDEFFGSSIPRPVFLLARHSPRIGGYAIANAWTSSYDSTNRCSEICVNVNAMYNLSDLMLILAHEMVHLWQFHRGGHSAQGPKHDQEYRDKAETIGLRTLPIQDNNWDDVRGEVIPGSKLDQLICRVIEDKDLFLPYFPNQSIDVDIVSAAQPMPGTRADGEGTDQEDSLPGTNSHSYDDPTPGTGNPPAPDPYRQPQLWSYLCFTCGAEVKSVYPDLVIMCGKCRRPFVCSEAS